MRAAVMENTENNLQNAKYCLHMLLPNCIVNGFTDGKNARCWCEAHSNEIDLFIGNWWNVDETANGAEGANIASIVKWQKKPKIILCGESEMFRDWSIDGGADGYILRPVTVEKLRDIL